MTDVERELRATVASLLHATGERPADPAGAIDIDRSRLPRKRVGPRPRSPAYLRHPAAHHHVQPADLLRGVDHALRLLPPHRRADTPDGGSTTTEPGEEYRIPRLHAVPGAHSRRITTFRAPVFPGSEKTS
ncbi:hypothetical protein FNQ90_15215 [Streptomyces alkaliphilus]|uniref:Uncharacterized protein n=1 Tax=Streptomyces alkaliphilus TaxID=1472722 RepID=A0A7W3Y2L8_9ACTN|nr:hypothetical protein [Streptomyces alkaliphilus]MBB0245412.1 hypothetical protein [Streptomyces alkaliphilus]